MEVSTIIAIALVAIILLIGLYVFSNNVQSKISHLFEDQRQMISKESKALHDILNTHLNKDNQQTEEEKWVATLKNVDSKKKKLDLAVQASSKYPHSIIIHKYIISEFLPLLRDEDVLLNRKAVLDKLIPTLQRLRDHVYPEEYDEAIELLNQVESEAIRLINDLDKEKRKVLENNVSSLQNKLTEVKDADYGQKALDGLINEFKDIDSSIDKDTLFKNNDLTEQYSTIANEFRITIEAKMASLNNKKIKDYNINKLRKVDATAKKIAENEKFSNEEIESLTPELLPDESELATSALNQYLNSLYMDLFTKADSKQRKRMTEIAITDQNE